MINRPLTEVETTTNLNIKKLKRHAYNPGPERSITRAGHADTRITEQKSEQAQATLLGSILPKCKRLTKTSSARNKERRRPFLNITKG